MIKTDGFIEREIEPEKVQDKEFKLISAVTLVSINGKELKSYINVMRSTLKNSIAKIHSYDNNDAIMKCLDMIKNRYSKYNYIEYYGIGGRPVTIYAVFENNEQNENILIFGRFRIDKNGFIDFHTEIIDHPEELNSFKE